MTTLFDPNTWYGDTEALAPYVELLVNSKQLCEEAFVSEHEAFVAGLGSGSRRLGVAANRGWVA
jgi:hypothetical protein